MSRLGRRGRNCSGRRERRLGRVGGGQGFGSSEGLNTRAGDSRPTGQEQRAPPRRFRAAVQRHRHGAPERGRPDHRAGLPGARFDTSASRSTTRRSSPSRETSEENRSGRQPPHSESNNRIRGEAGVCRSSLKPGSCPYLTLAHLSEADVRPRARPRRASLVSSAPMVLKKMFL